MASNDPLPLPIAAVELPGTPLALDGFTVVVGPNSSGKTQLLRDLQAAVSGLPRRLVVVKSIEFTRPPPLAELLKAATQNADLALVKDQNGNILSYKKLRHQLGTSDGAGQDTGTSEIGRQYELLMKSAERAHTEELPHNPLLQLLNGASCASLFLENRLTLLQDAGLFDYLLTPPSGLVQALYMSREARELLEEELSRVFDRAIWVDYTRNLITLLAADADTAPGPELRVYPSEVSKHRALASEGDGLRSYAAVCATLLLSRQPLCLIDEPELCLHPPQAYALGTFIGSHALEHPRGLIIATHSSHVLRGILDSGASPNILRLTRNQRFRARRVEAAQLTQAIKNPRARAEAVLDGLFTECAVFCEGDGDRLVYETVYTALPVIAPDKEFRRRTRDLRFVPTAGLSGSVALLDMCRGLGIPAAVIIDLDLLTQTAQLCMVAKACGATAAEIELLELQSGKLLVALRDSPPEVTPLEMKESLLELANGDFDWTKGQDAELRERLGKLRSALSRTRSIKTHGLSLVPEPLRTDLMAILETLKKLGLFIVPVGTLESWIHELMKDVSRSDKTEWAMTAAERLRTEPPILGADIWGFIGEIDRFARARADELALQVTSAPPLNGDALT